MPLPILVPVLPDFSTCGVKYGEHLSVRECSNAGSQLPVGNTPTPYVVGGSHGSYTLPWVGQDGNCMILLEKAGPATSVESMTLIPNDIRGMVGHLINDCVTADGLGGFATRQFGNLRTYIARSPTNYLGPFPPSTSFITVTVSDISGDDQPGDRDPIVPAYLKLDLIGKARTVPPALRMAYTKDAWAMGLLADRMILADSSVPWWQASRASLGLDEMAYECDSNLGSPYVKDCFLLEYSKVGAPSDSIKVTPGVPNILSSNKCNVAITSTLPIILTWKQIRAALDMLMNFCLKYPLHQPVGGKAFYGHQAVLQPPAIGGRKKKRKSADITGLNALPPHVNITLYEPGALHL